MDAGWKWKIQKEEGIYRAGHADTDVRHSRFTCDISSIFRRSCPSQDDEIFATIDWKTMLRELTAKRDLKNSPLPQQILLDPHNEIVKCISHPRTQCTSSDVQN